MTREEAIKWLKIKRECYDYEGMSCEKPMDAGLEIGCDYCEEAIDMAIEALRREEAEEKGYCHRIMPSNVEVVVRCKDCKHWASAEDYDCEVHSGAFGADDFCSYGERKGGDSE